MSTTIWKGSINFGMVSMPVKVSAAARDERIDLNQIVLGSGEPHAVGIKNYDKVTGAEVSRADIEKGYKVAEGQYVVLTKDTLEKLEPKSSKIISVEQFVAAADIDPVYFDKSYYIVPEVAGQQAFALLVAAMKQGNKRAGKNLVGIAKWTHSGRENLVAFRLYGTNGIMMHTLFFHDEVRDRPLLDEQPVDENMLTLAGKLLEQMTVPFNANAYNDTYRMNLQHHIDAAIAKKEYQQGPVSATPAGPVPDIMEALKASISKAPEKKGKAKTAKS